jgi:leucyl aminopeptidase
MKVKIENVSLIDIKCDLLVVNEFEGVKTPGGATGAADKALNGQITKMTRNGEIDGKLGKINIIHTLGKLPAERVAVVGLGKREEFGLDEVRVASAAAIRAAKGVKAKKVASIVHGAGIGGLDAKEAAQATVEGSILGEYEFEGYKEKKREDGRGTCLAGRQAIDELIIVERTKEKAKVMEEGARLGEIVANAENRARDLVNAPSNKITPTYIANYAKKIGLKCQILDPKAKGMEAIWAIAKGSKEPAKVVVLKAESGKRNTGTMALIGKGITFDAGGISLKPSKKLWEMKIDMAGAAAVIEAMRAIKLLGIKKNVIAVIPLTENMPDGGALKPGDVVSSLSKKTIEVISTDAEGRMILADAITYAKKLGATQMVTIATLTGGCITALGDVASGIMGNNDKLVSSLIGSSWKTGEKMWELPLYKEYKEYIKSNIADMKNASEGRGASPSTGGIFLQYFVGKTPWAHIDIAGTAYISRNIGYLSEGATGVAVRTLVEFVKSQ